MSLDPTYATCGAVRNGKPRCRKPAGWGTSHVGYGRCRLHGGSTRTQVLHSAKLEAEAMALRVMGVEVSIAPEDALQKCIDITHGEILYCDLQIAKLREADAVAPISSERTHEELDRHGDVHELSDRTSESTAGLHIWITVRQGAVDRLARYSKMALDAGVEERRVQLGERQADLVAAVIIGVFADRRVGLSDEQRTHALAVLPEHVGRFDEPPVIDGRAVAA